MSKGSWMTRPARGGWQKIGTGIVGVFFTALMAVIALAAVQVIRLLVLHH
ncbi:MAG TPA: hypothetical protein VFQ38_04385 [Longimicrobiales bacterium]|nr:hypothetical protein [Longimicrobiales bacterium]